jgi:multisubunit Na+/H+ antiporter MnhB subunit
VDLLQTWLLLGVPGLVIAGGLFVGRSQLRALFGYVTLFALVVAFVTTPGGGLSAAVIGALVVFAVAAGRGTHTDRRYREHHQDRRRLTTAAGTDD